ncbi:MAG: hypothetical protein O2897_05055 [bacterium]|nr:hypothetical protein [bacterium]
MGLSKDAKRAYDSSVLRSFRGRSDCQPNCPKVDIWEYAYKAEPNLPVVVSKKPISTQKKYWKVPFEARLVGITLYGDNPKYVQGLENFIASNKSLKKFNNIPADTKWAYDTFTFRIYVPKRNPNSKNKSPLKGELPESFIQKLLDMGCEIAFVDNGLEKVGVDSFFWRLMVAAEPMPNQQAIRYMIRDADWIVTGVEAFVLGEWINSSFQFLRPQLMPTCFSPLAPLNSAVNGRHEGLGPFHDLKTFIEHYPYRLMYGDDELFARDMIWPLMLEQGSILTYYFQNDFFTYVSEPYKGSCGRPTQRLCDEMNPGHNCPDKLIPSWLIYPYMQLGNMNDNHLALEKQSFYDMHIDKYPETKEAAQGLGINPLHK